MSERESVGPLPVDVTSYVGRGGELTNAKRLLAASPVVTLTGVGGVGKTRLARRLTAELHGNFRDGAVFVELGEVRNGQLLATTVAGKLGLYDQSDRPPVDVIIDYLRDRQFLLVLDNCEHLIEACATFVAALVTACHHLTVLTTSRQSLDMAGEQLMPVPPLSVPGTDIISAADLDHYDAVRLFIDRARAVLPSFQVTAENYQDIARLCDELEGLPLAIELAAVRLRSLSLRQITERLTQRFSLLTQGNRFGPQRQQTLRALIDWSYELCSPAEQLVLARASVFSGGFDLDAAEHVCGGTGDDVLDIIDGLVAKSLLQAEERGKTIRYRMLETVREYGNEHLSTAGEQKAIARRHRDWYARLVGRYAAGWIDGEQVAWIERVRGDHANIRVALDFCADEPGEVVVGLRMATQLDIYWTVRGFLSEARMWINRLLTSAPADVPERVLAQWQLAWCALMQGDIELAVAALVTGSALAEKIGDDVLTARMNLGWGLVNLFTGQEALARDLFAAALVGFDAHDILDGKGLAGFLQGLTTAVTGDVEQGRALIKERIAANEAIGERYWLGWGFWNLGMVELLYGDAATAEEVEMASFRLAHLLDSRTSEAFTIHAISTIAVRNGQMERSAILFGIASTLWRALGAKPWRFGIFTTKFAEFGAQSYEALGDEKYKKLYHRGAAMSHEQAVRFVLGEEPAETAAQESPLTKRETEVAELVADGLSNRDIAAKLFISPRTAETHVDHILTKLGFNTRAQIAAWVSGQDAGKV